MSTNDTEVEDNTTTTEDDEKLRQDLKQAVANDSKSATEQPAPEAPNAEETEEAEGTQEPEATLTNQVPSEPDRDIEWYKKAYDESTKEALRLKGELDKTVEAPPVTPVTEQDNPTPEQMYLRSKIAEETQEAFKPFLEKYPQLKDDASYKEFVSESELLGRVFVEKNKRLPTPRELYSKTVASLGWSPDNSEQLGSAIKAGAETARTSSGTPAIPQKSKVTEDMIAMNQKMYPNKSRAEIIEELEPYIT